VGGGGAEQQLAFDEIKKYLSSMLVMKAPKARILFWLYIATEDSVIGDVLTQVMNGKEHIITYLSRRLLTLKYCILSLKSYVYPYFLLVLN
jgi:hypothetical protein